MQLELRVSLPGLVICCSQVMDLVSPRVGNHHNRVAYIASRLSDSLGVSRSDWRDVVLAASLHDVGALSLKERIDALQFELDHPHDHAFLGFHLLQHFPPLARAARIVQFHHVPWNDGQGAQFAGQPVPLGSHIVHLADRISVLLRDNQEPLGEASHIASLICEQSGRMFKPDLVDLFVDLAAKEHFWLDLGSVSSETIQRQLSSLGTVELDLTNLLRLGEMFARVIDFRSPYTATHSAGVAAAAESIARIMGFSGRECLRMRVAGHIHDLGKLRIPREILEKPTTLTDEERMVIRSHTYYAFRAMEPVTGLEEIRSWAFLHHERIDGTGYPFRLDGDELSLGSRIMAVADVFTAVTEDRPYRSGLSKEDALILIRDMVRAGALDSLAFEQLRLNFEEINQLRREAQAPAINEYRQLEGLSPHIQPVA